MESETGELAEAIKPVIDFDDHMVTNLDLPFIAATPSVVPINTAKIAFTRREENCLLPVVFSLWLIIYHIILIYHVE